VPYFLDGNNLIGRGGRDPSADEDRGALVRELCDRLRRTRARAVLFFDGVATPGATSFGDLAIRFSGSASADDAILREVSRAAAPAEIIVVTADRGLARRARDSGAKAMAPEEFWRRFGTARSGHAGGSSKVDVDEWMRYFGDERNRDGS